MIQLGTTYGGIDLKTYLEGVLSAPASIVLNVYRNDVLEAGVSAAATATLRATGRYWLSFTTLTSAAGWSVDDHVVMYAVVTIGGDEFEVLKYDSNSAGGRTAIFQPAIMETRPRLVGHSIPLYTGEVKSSIIEVISSETGLGENLSGFATITLTITTSKATGAAVVQSFTNGQLNRDEDSTGQIAFVNNTDVTSLERTLLFALRANGGDSVKEVVVEGTIPVKWAAGA